MAALTNVYKENDSFKAKFTQAALASRGAATLTKVKISSVANNLERCAKKHRWGNTCPKTFTFRQLRGYVLFRKDEKIGARSLQNDMSIIRRALGGVGREEFAQKICSNSALGVSPGTRIGGGLVVDPGVLASALENAATNTKALIKLSRYLGLRERESVMSGDSINEWELALSQGRPITVRYGTKGGRLRSLAVEPGILDKALEGVRAAQEILRQQQYLVVSKNLKAAVEQHSDRLAKLGLKGENSCHSLRRAFAMNQYKHYLDVGCSHKVALARTSNDLGHGDTRGRWVYNNYLRATFEKEKRENLEKCKK
jgi:hypothetical protein